jgi:hypothetical protein
MKTDPPTVVLGAPRGDRIELAVHSRAYPGGLRVYDHDWLNVEVVARTAARSWRFMMYLRAEDMARFAAELADLRAGRATAAQYDSPDGWLEVDVDAHTIRARAREGHTEKVVALHEALDADALAQLAEAVAAVAAAYPVRR